jgi:hypothetical protein
MLSNRRQVSPSSKDEPQFQTDKSRHFQRKVPHAVFDDPRLDLRSFYLLLQKARNADKFALNQVHIRKLHGLGSDGFYAGLARIRALGYLARWQEHDENGFVYAAERLDLSAAPTSIRQAFEILRPNVPHIKWQAQALLDYLYSHAHSYPSAACDLAARFGVCEKTIRRHLKELGKARLIELIVEHDEYGHFGRQGYIAVRECSGDNDRPDKNRKQDPSRPDICRTHKSRTHRNRTHNKNDSFNNYDLSNKDEKYPTVTYTTREKARAEPADASLRFDDCKKQRAETKTARPNKKPRSPGRRRIVGKDSEQDLFIERMLEPEGVDENLETIDYWISHDQLRKRLLDALHGRIGRALLTDEGIWNAKRLIAADSYFLEATLLTEEDARAAIASFIEGPLEKFSSAGKGPGPWLNDWTYIAIRMAGDAYSLLGRYSDFDPEKAYRKETYDPDSDIPF